MKVVWTFFLVNISFKYSGFSLFTHLKPSIANKRGVMIFIPETLHWIKKSWFVIVQQKTQCAFLNILNSVEGFHTSEHPYNWPVIKIWHYEWFINDHTNLMVKNLFKTLKNNQLPTGLCAHVWNMFCEIHFVTNLHTEYFHSFRGRYDCIFNIYHQTINITTMGWISIDWTFSGLAFKEFCSNQFMNTTGSFVKNFRMSSIVSLEYEMQLSSV